VIPPDDSLVVFSQTLGYGPCEGRRLILAAEEDTVVLEAIAAYWDRRDRHVGAANAVHDTVRRLIVSGVLAPGTRLGEEDYARHFSVSRTPVREAFLRLEAERLAERSGGRSLVVAGVTPDEILEIYVVRVAVDGLAARLAAETARPQDIANLRWINDQLREASVAGDAPRMATINLQFHEEVCKSGRNTFLLDLMITVHDRARRFPGTTFSDGSRPAEAIAEHERMIDAIERREADEAERLARLHMTNAMETRIRLLRTAEDPAGAAVAGGLRG
jgi:DNA-binding GntR family transcriptional regulator